jgi:hypothetical protein
VSHPDDGRRFRMGWNKWSGEEARAPCSGGRIRSRAFAPADVPRSASERPNSGNGNAEDTYTQARMQLDGHVPLPMSWPLPKAHIAPEMLEYGGTTGSHVQRGMGMTGGRMPRTSAPRRPPPGQGTPFRGKGQFTPFRLRRPEGGHGPMERMRDCPRTKRLGQSSSACYEIPALPKESLAKQTP